MSDDDNERDLDARLRLTLSDLADAVADLAHAVGNDDLARRANALATRIYEG